jgi:hypothetical protein
VGESVPVLPEGFDGVELSDLLYLLQIRGFINVSRVVLIPHLPQYPGPLERVSTLHILLDQNDPDIPVSLLINEIDCNLYSVRFILRLCCGY